MNGIAGLIFIHIWLVVWIVFSIGFIWGNLAEKSYNSRMKWRKWLMPGKLADKEFFVKWTKRFCYFALPFGILVYLMILFKIIDNQTAALTHTADRQSVNLPTQFNSPGCYRQQTGNNILRIPFQVTLELDLDFTGQPIKSFFIL